MSSQSAFKQRLTRSPLDDDFHVRAKQLNGVQNLLDEVIHALYEREEHKERGEALSQTIF